MSTIISRVDVSGRVDVSDLTWEQKERVLRHLFAKMNGANEQKKPTSAFAALQSRPAEVLSIEDVERLAFVLLIILSLSD